MSLHGKNCSHHASWTRGEVGEEGYDVRVVAVADSEVVVRLMGGPEDGVVAAQKRGTSRVDHCWGYIGGCKAV